MKRLCACVYFSFEMCFKLQEHWINSQDPAAPQSNSSGLEIDDFGETATLKVNLRKHFYYNCIKKTPFSEESSGTVRIGMLCPILLLLTFEMCIRYFVNKIKYHSF